MECDCMNNGKKINWRNVFIHAFRLESLVCKKCKKSPQFSGKLKTRIDLIFGAIYGSIFLLIPRIYHGLTGDSLSMAWSFGIVILLVLLSRELAFKVYSKK